MSSTNKTTNLGLNQWIGSDRSKREDFVDDNKKIDDWAGQVNTQLNACVKKDNIINNCSTTEEGFALDARQGKTLFDILKFVGGTQLQTIWGGNLNELTNIGFYRGNNLTNAPQNDTGNFVILHLEHAQIAVHLYSSDIFIRTFYNSEWKDWKKITTTALS